MIDIKTAMLQKTLANLLPFEMKMYLMPWIEIFSKNVRDTFIMCCWTEQLTPTN